MPPTSSHIPLPGHIAARSTAASAHSRPAFALPIRLVLALLSWTAFGLASYLAYTSVTGQSVAGCGLGSAHNCDIVLTSAWSKWLGVPVAVLGLICYAALASLSILLNWRGEWNRAITTAFTALAVLAAGASVWFIGLQVFKIGEYCPYCLATDACGILIGLIAMAASIHCLVSNRGSRKARGPQPGLLGMKSAVSNSTSSLPSISSAAGDPPSLAAAFGVAVPLLAVLIAGQFLFAQKTFQVEKVALAGSFKMDESTNAKSESDSATGTTRVAMRVPSEGENNADAAKSADAAAEKPANNAGDQSNVAIATPSADETSSTKAAAKTEEPAEKPKERIVKFLGGKLSLDTYKHPLIGSPEAPHVAIEMVSYDCPHCRKMYAFIEQALARYDNQVALIIMPIPLDKGCNRLISDPTVIHPEACATARYAIAIGKLAPSQFVKFHDFLMTGKDKDKPPAMERIIPKAYGIVDGKRLRPVTNGPEVKKQLESYVDLYGQLQSQSAGNKNFGLPVQILGDHVMTGSVEKVEDVFKAWEEHLGVSPK